VRVWDLAPGPAVSDPFPGHTGRVIAVTAAQPAGRLAETPTAQVRHLEPATGSPRPKWDGGLIRGPTTAPAGHSRSALSDPL